MNRIEAINILTVVIGVWIEIQAVAFFLKSTECMQYDAVWSFCISSAQTGFIVALISTLLNILNLQRIINSYKLEEAS